MCPADEPDPADDPDQADQPDQADHGAYGGCGGDRIDVKQGFGRASPVPFPLGLGLVFGLWGVSRCSRRNANVWW